MTTTVTMPAQLQQVFKRNQVVATVVLMIAALAAAPLMLFVLKGIATLVALAVAGAVGLTILGCTPFLAFKFANWRLKRIKGEAAANPVETLQGLLMEKRRALQTFKGSIEQFAAQVLNYEGEIGRFKRAYPDEAEKFEAQLTIMKRLQAERKAKLLRADEQCDAFELEIQKANAIWNMSQAAIRMNQAAGLQTGDVFEKIKAETAVDAVQTSMNTAFAQLEMALVEEEMDRPMQLPQLAHQKPRVVDALPIKQEVQVKRY